MKVQAKHGKVTQNMHGASRNYRYVWDLSERSVEDNFDMMNKLKAFHKKETKEMMSSLAALEEKLYKIQAQIYDLQNQNCEYELNFSHMGLATDCRIPETKMSFETGEPLPWKRFARENMFNPNKKKNEE